MAEERPFTHLYNCPSYCYLLTRPGGVISGQFPKSEERLTSPVCPGPFKLHRKLVLTLRTIDLFARHLSLYSGEVQRRRAVGRFQQKITTKFCVPRGRREQRSAARSARGVELDGERSNTNGVPFTTFSFSSCGGKQVLPIVDLGLDLIFSCLVADI